VKSGEKRETTEGWDEEAPISNVQTGCTSFGKQGERRIIHGRGEVKWKRRRSSKRSGEAIDTRIGD